MQRFFPACAPLRMQRQLTITACVMLGWLISPLTLADSSPSVEDLFEMDLKQLLNTRVTGSHLSLEAPAYSPITVIDQEQISRSGANSLDELLQQLPISAGYAGNAGNTYWGTNGNSSTHVNLRGLGINRTLVLIDGHRIANGGTGANAAVDLNAIPLSLVERIEIFRDGASAIYGADAVAGVVNIITRTNLQGAEASIRYGETSKHDGATRNARISWGANGQLGASNNQASLLLDLNHYTSDPINMASRAPCGLGEVNGELVCVNSGNTIGGRARLADGQRINFNQIAGGDGDFYEPYSASKHNFNANPYLNAINPVDRTSLSAKAELITQSQLRLFSTVMYTKQEAEQLASPGTLGLNRPMSISADHPTNPTGQNLVLERRRLLEAGTRSFYQDIDYSYGLIGMEYKIGDNWLWQSSINHSRNTGLDGWTNVANLDRVDQTLDTSVCSNAPNAAIPCGDYLGYGDLSAQVLDYIMTDIQDRGGNEQQAIATHLSGELMQLPAGALMLAAGAEVREDKAWRYPDPLVLAGIANSGEQEVVKGRLKAQEAFVETNIPLLRDLPAIKSLELSGALRYSDYDLFGDNTNYKLALNWQPLDDVELRSSYASAFRTPNVPELFLGNLVQNRITRDPCSNWSSLPANSITRQNCQAAGVPANYQQLVTSVPTTVGGNPDLQPEEANTRTLGILWQPAFAPGLSASLDYYSINIDKAIVTIDGTTRLAACYNSTNLSHPLCGASHFTRNPFSGEINYLSVQWVNAAHEKQQGVDLRLSGETEWEGWQAQLDWYTSYLDSYQIQPYQNAGRIDYAGKVTSGRGSYLKWRSQARLTLARANWSGSYGIRYLHKGTQLDAIPGSIGANIPAVSYHHLQMRYQAAKTLELALGIDNLFDRSAPYVSNWLDTNTDTMTYDQAGRRWYLGATIKW
ncbi:TonB-dependent receptor [Cellvibrio sp. pealriver]|uniref:TonB-dependent receptor n=1 Tax=Cellvibrio sp. pealriver TaxID=1622269 RepID=UPI0009E30979|nr:TonB-dependent receptor [Cellvibrio sp. pealriver]